MNTKTFLVTLSALFVTLCLKAQAPVAVFESNATTGCAPIIVDFQDKSTGTITSWKWDFGNGSTSTKQHPSTSYFAAGNYTVSLTVSNASGSSTTTKSIRVYDGPTVDFTSDKTSSCAPGRIQFTDRSTPSPGTVNTSWFWDFGDGTVSTEKNPLHVYRKTGKFTVFLKITNDKGCSKMLSKVNMITVTTGVVPNFTNTLPTVCSAPAAITFTNRSTGPANTLSYTWLFGDGGTDQNTNTTHTYNKNDTFTVSLVVRSSLGCYDTLTKTNSLPVGGIKTDFAVSDTLCGGINMTFRNSSFPSPSSARWTFPDGTISTAINPVKAFAAGNHVIKVVNQYATCKDSVTKTIKVSAKPVIDFTSADTVKCSAPATVNFQNKTNEAVSYVWTFSNLGTSTATNPSFTFTSYTNYNVKLKATNLAGCTDSLTKTGFVKVKKPVITFKNLPVRECVPYTLSPEADINTLDEVRSYQWDFGDGTIVTGRSPRHTYTRQGTYPVKLTITTSTGCTETYTLANAVRVGTKPTASFSSNVKEACASTPVSFNNSSPMPTDEYLWLFGDGETARSRNTTHRFTDTGNLNVTLIVYNNGCGDTATDYFVKINPPIARFTYKPNCADRMLFTFKDSSIEAKTWEWKFMDNGQVVSGTNTTTHRFPGYGTYNVVLNVTNGSCSSTDTMAVTIVDQTPDFTASSQVGCKNFRPTFYPTSPVEVTDYYWDFGNGAISGTRQPTRVYSDAGKYTVTLTTTDIYGCKDSRTKNEFIQVLGPKADFSSTNNKGCKGTTVNFVNESKEYGSNAINSWRWDFGDKKGQSTEASPSYKYDTTGSLHVKLVVQDAAGCMDSITKASFVQLTTIKAAWTSVSESCPKAVVTFTNTTPGSYTSTWDFGDKTAASTLKSPTHAYTDTGSYTIKLKVRDAIGCEDSLTRENYLRVGLPDADFTANNMVSYCTPFEARFTNTSKFYNAQSWSFLTNTATSTDKDPVFYYTQTINDPVRLIVTSPGGCKDTVIKNMQIKNAAEGKVIYGPLSACAPIEVNFEAFEPINARFTWDFGDGNIIDTTANAIAHIYQDFGKYVPKVILEEQCVIPLKGVDTIAVYGVDAKIVADRRLFCDTGTVAFADSSITNSLTATYNWNFGDGIQSSQKHPVHFYRQPGNYTVRLNVITGEGCEDSAILSTVKVVQSPQVSIGGDTTICLTDRVQFTGRLTNPDTSALSWQWQFPNGNAPTVQNPELQLFSQPGSFQIKTLVTNSSGCKDSAIVSLRVHPIPTVSLPATLSTYAGANLTLPATYSQDVVSYNWAPSEGLNCINCPQPIASPKLNTKYTVIATDKNGCQNSGDITLTVTCPAGNLFVPNTFSPNGDGRNDIFYVRGKGIDRVKTFRVFNRWGEIVFEKREVPANIESTLYGWDGKTKGNNPHTDVYIYQVEVYCGNGEIIRTQGNVALIQ